MVVIFALGAIFLIVGAAVLGRGFGSSRLPPTIEGPVKGSGEGGCENAAAEWDKARQNACNAKSDEAAAHRHAADLRGQVAAATAAHLALVVAAIATYAAAAAATATVFGIPAGIVLTGVAIGLTVAAAAALLVLIGLTAALTAADDDLRDKMLARQQWEGKAAAERERINRECPPERAQEVLSRPSPC